MTNIALVRSDPQTPFTTGTLHLGPERKSTGGISRHPVFLHQDKLITQLAG